jgi:amidase
MTNTKRLFSVGVLLIATIAVAVTGAVTRLPSADGQFWDIQDTSPWAQDSGGIATGGRANPFNGFGYLKLDVRTAGGTTLTRNLYLRGFGLAHDGAERFDSITPVFTSGIVIDRGIYAPKNTNYLRYVDSFTNTSDEPRLINVAWGGAVGAFEDGGRATVATTSDGNRTIDLGDSFVTMMQNARGTDPAQGPSGHGPSAHVLGARAARLLTRIGDMYGDPFRDAWPGYDPAHVGYVFTFTLRPGATGSLMTFVVKGLSEVYDPRGGFPVPIKDGIVAPKSGAPYSGIAPVIPAAGTQIEAVTAVARRLVANPDVRGLTLSQQARILNWTLTAGPAAFSVVEKTAPELQDMLNRRVTTSEDIVRDYLTRLATYDRNGPVLRSMLALNPRAIAEARALDAERAAGRVRGPLHGIPVAFKDNIDVLGLPTTGGARALVDHRPRLDSRMASGMRRAGAVILGKANLDEFPFGDFGISSVGGTIGNAYDASLSVAGSSGGSATAVTSSFVTLAFGTDTCNSLSNPAAFASLATIRTTRGLTSRAGVMPLNTYNDAVGPMAKSVRELALVLDQVAGVDPEDEATQGAAAHAGGSFASALDAGANLKGRRIGVMRQLFVGITGEREIATMMDGVVRELRAAGATVVDVAIPDLDAEYRAARGSAPGSLKSAWTAYLTRGASGGEKVLTIDDLIASGKMAPAGTRRLQDALRPVAGGDEGRAAVAAFYAARERFRDLFVGLMDREKIDSLLYPANQARPHTHEGGLERYGGEPGTCEESAMTGLPQVTVAAGFIGGRYPFGISFLGRLWSDRDVLAIAHAYELATHHRRPPPIAR